MGKQIVILNGSPRRNGNTALLAGGNGRIGDIAGKPELKQAYQLGNATS